MAERINYRHSTHSHSRQNDSDQQLGSMENSQQRGLEINAFLEEMDIDGKTAHIISQSEEEAQQFVDVEFEQTEGE